MAIAISEPTAEVASTTNAATYAFGAFTPTAGALLVVFAFVSGTVAAGTVTNTGTTLTWHKVGSQVYNTTDTAYCFIARVPSSVSASTITVDVTGDNGTGAVICIFQVTGHNVDNPIYQFVTGTASGTNPTFTRVAANTNNGYLAGYGIPLSPPTSTPPTGWTEICDAGYATPTAGGVGAFRAGGETSTSVAFTQGTGGWGGFYLEINEAAVNVRKNSLMMQGVG